MQECVAMFDTGALSDTNETPNCTVAMTGLQWEAWANSKANYRKEILLIFETYNKENQLR